MIAPLEIRERRPLAKETKFLVSPAMAAQIKAWARERLEADPAAQAATDDTYTITSLYLDTPRLDIFSRNVKCGLSKYRIRRYGQERVAFLERKLRTSELLAKYRVAVPLEELDQLMADACEDAAWAGCWFRHRMTSKGLRPVCLIAYERTARVGMSMQGPIRLTLDENLRALPVAQVSFPEAVPGAVALLSERVVLELKYRAALPGLFKELLARFRLTPVPFSKYRAAVPALGVGTHGGSSHA